MAGIEKPEWWSSDHWATPPEIVARLEAEFGAFDLDPCCRRETAKAPTFYTEEDNGLDKPWFGRVFLNPPWSAPAPWLTKSLHSITVGDADLVVALLPVRSETRWFHQLVLGRAKIRFLQGRVRWIGWQGTPIPSPIPIPSMFAIYGGSTGSADG